MSLEELARLVGTEHRLDDVSRELNRYARASGASGFGAYQINCSDECERECIDAFQEHFVSGLLPELKFWERSSFRTINLGARYERGAVAIAEDHYTTDATEHGFKSLVIKLNAHVSRERDGKHLVYGVRDRYGQVSTFCGALNAVLAGSQAEFAREIASSFDRCDPRLLPWLQSDVDMPLRALWAAVLHCQLQAWRVDLDIASFEPHSPTEYLVIASVTINQADRDHEVVCGLIRRVRGGSRDESEEQVVGVRPDQVILEHSYGKVHLRAR